VLSAGGHSSVPPRHTVRSFFEENSSLKLTYKAIGMLSSAIVTIEDNHFPADLTRESVYYQQLVCEALYKPGINPTLKQLVLESMKEEALDETGYNDGNEADVNSEDSLSKINAYFSRSNRFAAQVGTTIAVDLIGGGVKSNALPNEAWSVVNHRISDRRYASNPSLTLRALIPSVSSVEEVMNHWKTILGPIARKYNLSFDPFGLDSSTSAKTAIYALRLSDAYGTALEPSPISPTFGDPIWEIFAGTIRSSIESNPRKTRQGKTGGGEVPVVIAPSLGLGNTGAQKEHWVI